jgi:hypothetical protein
LSRNRSTFVCPKCGLPGSGPLNQWSRSSRYAISDKTTLAKGKWVTVEESGYCGIIQSKKHFKTYSEKYYHQYVKHFDSETGKQKKCYIDRIVKEEKEENLNPELAELRSSIDQIEYSAIELQKLLRRIKNKMLKYPPCAADDKKISALIRKDNPFEELFEIFNDVFCPGSSPSEWIKNGSIFMQESESEKSKSFPEEQLSNIPPEEIIKRYECYSDDESSAYMAQTIRSATHCGKTESFITCT